MNKQTFDPFKNLVLDDYEQEIEDLLPNDPTIKPIPKKEQATLKEAAKNTLQIMKKDENINIRIPYQTKRKLQEKAAKLGLKYQTLIGSILHQYAHS